MLIIDQVHSQYIYHSNSNLYVWTPIDLHQSPLFRPGTKTCVLVCNIHTVKFKNKKLLKKDVMLSNYDKMHMPYTSEYLHHTAITSAVKFLVNMLNLLCIVLPLP